MTVIDEPANTTPGTHPNTSGVTNENAMTASRDQIEAAQLERLQWTVSYAYENVPLYKEKFDAHGVHPSDLKELEDLAKFPYTEKEDLRKMYPFGMFAVPQSQVARIHASSGTTGLPTVVGYTAEDISTWADLVARCLRLSGVKPGDKVHNAYGYGLFTGGLGAHYGAERLGATVIPMSGGQTEKQIQLIQDFEPDAILATPTYLLAIADAMQKMGLDPRATSLKTAVLGAEPWTQEMRRELEQAWDLNACDIYGLSEVMGPGVAGESCETKDGSHIWEDHFRPEIIDPFDASQTMRGRRAGRARLHVPDQAGAADHPLPHSRPHAAAARHRRPEASPDGPHHGPQRRHDHPPRRQSLPVPDRGDRARHPGPLPALPAGADAAEDHGRADRAHRGAGGLRGGPARFRRRRAQARHQGARGLLLHHRGGGPGHARPLLRQAQAHPRPPRPQGRRGPEGQALREAALVAARAETALPTVAARARRSLPGNDGGRAARHTQLRGEPGTGFAE